MKVDLLLADAAQVDDRNKVHAIGLGWTNVPTPTPNFTVVVILDLDNSEVPNPITVHISLLDAERNPARPTDVEGPGGITIAAGGQAAPLGPERQGEPIRIPIAAPLGPLALTPGLYFFRATAVVGKAVEHAEQAFRVRSSIEELA